RPRIELRLVCEARRELHGKRKRRTIDDAHRSAELRGSRGLFLDLRRILAGLRIEPAVDAREIAGELLVAHGLRDLLERRALRIADELRDVASEARLDEVIARVELFRQMRRRERGHSARNAQSLEQRD